MQCILVKSDELENSCPLLHNMFFLNPRYARSAAIIFGKDGRKNMSRKPYSQHSQLELRLRCDFWAKALLSSLYSGHFNFVNSFEKKCSSLSSPPTEFLQQKYFSADHALIRASQLNVVPSQF